MNCQNCGAPMKFDHNRICFWCEYCTSICFPEESSDGIRITDEESNINCPICNIPLVLAYAGETQVFYCNKCRGILINQFSFLRAIQYIRSKTKELSPPPPVRFEELERKIYCPQCHRKMDTHPYAGSGNIVIDNCLHCMLNWLDRNELYRVTHSPDHSETYRNTEEYFESLLRSKKRYKDKR